MVGFLALLGNFQTLIDAVATPVDFRTYLVVGLASLSIMFLHEFAHGLVLAGFGGNPNSVGVMLFYFTPAFIVTSVMVGGFGIIIDGSPSPQSCERTRRSRKRCTRSRIGFEVCHHPQVADSPGGLKE